MFLYSAGSILPWSHHCVRWQASHEERQGDTGGEGKPSQSLYHGVWQGETFLSDHITNLSGMPKVHVYQYMKEIYVVLRIRCNLPDVSILFSILHAYLIHLHAGVPSKWLSIFSTFQLLPGVKVVIANPDTKGQCADSHLGEVSPRLAAVQHFLWTIQTIPVDGVMRSFYVISYLFIDRFGSTVHTMLQGTLWSMGTTRFMLNILTRI